MDFSNESKKKWMRWMIPLAIISVLLFFAIQNVEAVKNFFFRCFSLAFPLILGGAIAIIVNVPMRFFEEHLWKKSKNKALCALRRPSAFILSVLIIIGCLVGIVMVIIPELIESVKIIIAGAISLINKFDAMTAEEYAELPFGNLLMQIDWEKALTTVQDWLKNQSGVILKGAFSTLSSVVVALFDFIIAFVFAIFLIFSKSKLKMQAKRMIRVWMPKKFGEWLIHAISVTSINFKNFISGQTLEAVILGVLCLIGMLAFNIPYAPMVSVLVGITALIPVVGGFIGGGVGAFMILTVNPSKALFFVIFLVILQQLEGNIIYPKVMGKKVNLPGLWIIAAVTVGGGLAGPIGMLLSVPLTSTAYVLIKEATAKREDELKMSSESDNSVAEADAESPEEKQNDSTEISHSEENEKEAKREPTHDITEKQTKYCKKTPKSKAKTKK